MYHRATLVAALILASGCKKDEPEGASVAGCEPLAFAEHIDLAEASGADLIDAGLLLVSDSGNRGAYVLVDPGSGAVRERGQLPLGDAADDLEGLAHRGDRIFALSSSGWVHEYRRDQNGFELVAAPYPIGPEPWRCAKGKINCGANWEGLCLGEVTAGGRRCDGFAASMRDGALVCVAVAEGRLTLVPDVAIKVSPRHTLAGCAISAGRTWAVTNVLGANAILEVSAGGAVSPRLSLAPGSTEAVAARGSEVYRFSDTADRPSIAGRYRCP